VNAYPKDRSCWRPLMRIRWRGLELPSRVILDESVSTDYYGKFVIEPFEQGFGTTIGNALRRVLLSSLQGAAITTVKIAGVSHEFMSLPGVLEDVTEIILNMKGVVIGYDEETTRTITVRRNKAGPVTAGDIVCDPSIHIFNPEHVLATLTADAVFEAEMTVRTGRGFAAASENRASDMPLGVIPIDSVFSPVLRVRYRTEDMRVGQRTNYDRLILEVWTNGTVLPEDALVEAGSILRKYINPIVMYQDIGESAVSRGQPESEEFGPIDSALEEMLSKPISALNLSVRATNCLDAARISTLRELVVRTEADLLRFRAFGKTSLNEVHRKLTDLGLSLGMRLGAPRASTGAEMGASGTSGELVGQTIGSAGTSGASSTESDGGMDAFTMPD
jgi:DNA-directed RNA polymerase subunit alpha